eukprot:7025458-Prymnesium_polylepis.1
MSPSQPSKSSAERKGSTSALRVEALRKCGYLVPEAPQSCVALDTAPGRHHRPSAKCGLGGMERARAAT